MKNIPIIILNRDRLESTKQLVSLLINRNYNNIVILDNGSTYEPLLDWYSSSTDFQIYFNMTVAHNHHALHNLLSIQDEFFVSLLQNSWYVFTDSDLILHDTVPDNFIDDLINICIKYNKDKVGLGIHVNDMHKELFTDAAYWELMEFMKDYENQFTRNGGPYGIVEIQSADNPCVLYDAPIDTTFAVCKPNSQPIGSRNCIRTGYPYLSKHLPFYYDINSYPADELYYLKHISVNAETGFSSKVLKFL
jgi:hypothetical protein